MLQSDDFRSLCRDIPVACARSTDEKSKSLAEFNPSQHWCEIVLLSGDGALVNAFVAEGACGESTPATLVSDLTRRIRDEFEFNVSADELESRWQKDRGNLRLFDALERKLRGHPENRLKALCQQAAVDMKLRQDVRDEYQYRAFSNSMIGMVHKGDADDKKLLTEGEALMEMVDRRATAESRAGKGATRWITRYNMLGHQMQQVRQWVEHPEQAPANVSNAQLRAAVNSLRTSIRQMGQPVPVQVEKILIKFEGENLNKR